mgnify:CR=1 FL=1
MTLTCSYTLCAAHELYRPQASEAQNQETFGACANIHGHQYTVDVVLAGDMDPQTGMLINAYNVDEIAGTFLKKNLAHKFLNKDVSFFKDRPPTAEWIAFWIFSELKTKFPVGVTLKKIVVHETPTMSVEYSGM